MRADQELQRAIEKLGPLPRETLADTVYSALRKMIVHAQLPPNSKIVEDQLATALGVSRTPIREALQRLTYDGFIVPGEKGAGAYVAELTVQDIEEVYPLVEYLEALAVVQALPHLSDDDFSRMEDLTEEMARQAEASEVEKLVNADNEFHSILHNRSGNRRLKKIIRELRTQMERFEYLFFSTPEDVKLSLGRHRKLTRILRAGDATKAREALMEQWDIGRQRLITLVTERTHAEMNPSG